jgi:hypothetical protein
MGLVVRALLVWLLVLAVPAQGFAAVTMAVCGSNHQGGSAAAQMHEAAPADHAHHGGHKADHEHPQAALGAGQAGAAAASTAEAGDTNMHECSACASCCSVGAMLSTVLAIPALDFIATVFSTLVASVDAFAAGGPDRPPRLVLA